MSLLKYTGLDNMVVENLGDDGSPSTITNKQWHINNGDCFYGSKRSVSLANNGTFMVHIVTSTTKKTHANLEVTATGKATIDVYSGTTYTAAGTAVTIFPNNSSNVKSTSALAYHTPTTNVLGTQVYEGIVVANGTDVLGEGQDAKKILPFSTDILLVVTNTSGSAADYGINFDFYEV